MKSRVALVAVLALGVFMSGTGATLAVSGFANSGSASSTQYPQNSPHNKGDKGHHVVEGAHSQGGSDKCDQGSSAGSGSGSNSAECAEPTVKAVDAQSVQQEAVTGSSSSLPFTGFVAIPVLIIGLGLLGAGVAMRMRNRRGDHTV